MSTLVVYADVADNWLTSKDIGASHMEWDEDNQQDVCVVDYDGTWAAARAGSGSPGLSVNGSSLILAGTVFDASGGCAAGYDAHEGFLPFDTSSMAGGTPTAAVLNVSVLARPGLPLARVRAVDFGATVTTGDWVPGADLGGYPLVATYQTTVGGTGRQDMTSEAAMLDAINPNGTTRFLVSANSLESATWVDAYVAFYSADQAGTTDDPKLTVTYTEAPTGTPALTARLARVA